MPMMLIIVGENIDTTHRNTEALLDTSKEVSSISFCQSVGQEL
jgi:hypothetical protein